MHSFLDSNDPLTYYSSDEYAEQIPAAFFEDFLGICAVQPADHADVRLIEEVIWRKKQMILDLFPDFSTQIVEIIGGYTWDIVSAKSVVNAGIPDSATHIYGVKQEDFTEMYNRALQCKHNRGFKAFVLVKWTNLHSYCLFDWSCVVFPSRLEELTLSSSNFTGSLRGVHLINLKMNKVHLHNWDDVLFPLTLESLEVKKSNFDTDLRFNVNLKKLYLQESRSEFLRTRFPSSLEIIKLSNSILTACTDLSGLLDCINLKELHMDHVHFAGCIPDIPTSLQYLNVSHSNYHGDLSRTNIERLNMCSVQGEDGGEQFTNHVYNENPFAFIALPYKNLKYFNASNTVFRGNLSHCTNLIALELWGVFHNDWSQISYPKSLRYLNLNYSDFYGNSLLDTNIEVLFLRGVKHDNWSFLSFPKTLRQLDLEGSNFLGDLRQTRLQKLSLRRVQHTDGLEKPWTDLRLPQTLLELDLSGTNFDRDLSEAVNLNRLEMKNVDIHSWNLVRFPISLRWLNIYHSDFEGDLSYLTELDELVIDRNMELRSHSITIPPHMGPTMHGSQKTSPIIDYCPLFMNEENKAISMKKPESTDDNHDTYFKQYKTYHRIPKRFDEIEGVQPEAASSIQKSSEGHEAVPSDVENKIVEEVSPVGQPVIVDQEIGPGVRVMLEGHREYHGALGKVTRYHQKRNRWWVDLDSGRAILVKPDHLFPVQSS